jgi:hypothetical protein
MLFFRDDRGHIIKPTATYWGARLLTQEWAKPGSEPQEIYEANSDIINGNHDQIVTAYALRRPDGLWSLLLLNRDPARTFQASPTFRNPVTGQAGGFSGPVDVYQFSTQQYQLGGSAKDPQPIRSEAPSHQVMQPNPITLPPLSLTVVRGPVNAGFSQ